MTLLDESAAGPVARPDQARVDASGHHLDVMVGSDDVDATGLTADGRELPLLRGGRWCDG